MNMARILMLGGLTAGLSLPLTVQAQTAPGAAPAGPPPAASLVPNDAVVVPPSELEAGANSYTEGQARSRMEANGFSGITGLTKDDNGFWRATATHGGSSGDVAMDFRGRIAHGTGVATMVPRPATSGGAISGRASPDGTPGNPPGTALGRAVERATGAGTPDGTPGNPPSTAVGRAVDGVQGQPSAPDGTPGNPPGTAAGRVLDRAVGTNTTGTNPAPAR